jgi:hypothetical protein
MRAVAEVPENHPAFAQPSEPTPPVSEVQTSAPVESVPEPESVAEPEQPKEPVAAAPVESEDAIEEGAVYFRKKDGTFRKATKKEAMGELFARVNTLTGRLRGTEEELRGTKEALQRARPESQQPATQPVVDVGDPEPSLEQFVNEADPYKAYIAAQARWAARDERRSWEREASAKQASQQTVQQFQARAEQFRGEHPDYDEVLRANNLDVTPLLHHVITTDEHGPAIAYYLGSHPDVAYELVLQTASLPAQGPHAEVVRRLLTTRMSAAGSTGSARPAVRSSAPPPLNPVRTVSPALDEPPLTGNESFSEFVRKGNDQDRKRRESRFGA